MGAWTNSASQWFQYHLPQIQAERAHSIVMKPNKPVSPHALFVNYKYKSGSQPVLLWSHSSILMHVIIVIILWCRLCLGEHHNPEVYPRPDGTVYMCGFSDQLPLPESANDVIVTKDSVKSLHDMAGTISSSLIGAYKITIQSDSQAL